MEIKDVMSKNLIICDYDDNVLYASNLMKKYDVGFILVRKEKRLYGIITDRDLVCDLAEGTTFIENYVHKNVVTINENEDVLDALELMKKHKIKRLVITNEKKIVGVLSLSDLLNNVDEKYMIDALKHIYAINRNDNYFEANIDDFIL